MPSPIELPTAPATLTPDDPRFPAGLTDLSAPPAQLRVAGSLPLPERTVAIVGTRHADDDACEFARSLAGELAAAGCAVVSGGARGIDAAAHRGALEAGGATIAVLATGFDQAYPRAHGPMFARIARDGALITEASDGQAPRPGLFLQRNRLIAALAQAVVVVQAPTRSGALSTAAHAQQLGRPLFVVPASPWDPRGAGCLGLLRSQARICTRPRDVLSVAPLGRADAVPPEPSGKAEAENSISSTHLDPDDHAVWAYLGGRARHTDEIARGVGLPAARVQRALVGLMLLGLVEERDGARYARRPFPKDRR